MPWVTFQEGPSTNPGVNTRALTELFRLAGERANDFTTEITVSILEIYNEQIRDLLINDPKSKQTK